MIRVEHSGNTCAVGWTCFTAFSVSDQEWLALRNLGCSNTKGSCYFSLSIKDWPAVYAYLTLLGHDVEFLPSYLSHSKHKVQQWKEAFPEVFKTPVDGLSTSIA